MKLTAADIMASPAVTARQDMTVRELIELLHQSRITGVPVVDEHEHLVGVISLTDLAALGVESREAVREADSDFHSSPAMDGMAAAEGLLRPEDETLDDAIGDLMSREAITAGREASLGELADILITHGIHRVIVVDGDRAVGIVSIRDILEGLRTWDQQHASSG